MVFCGDLPVVSVYNGLADRKPDPHAFMGITAVVWRGGISVKQGIQPVRADAGSIIPHMEMGKPAVCINR